MLNNFAGTTLNKVDCSSLLTVQSYLMQSSQKREAENLDRMATVFPKRRACPTARIPPAVWYSGRAVYRMSSALMGIMYLEADTIDKYLRPQQNVCMQALN